MGVTASIIFSLIIIIIIGLFSLRQWIKSKWIINAITLLSILAGSILFLLSDESTKKLYLNTEGESKEQLISTDHYILNKGKYTIEVFYTAKDDNSTLSLINDKCVIYKTNLNKDQTVYQYDLVLESDVQNFWIEIENESEEQFLLSQISMDPSTRFYTDNIFILVVLWCAVIIALLYRHLHKKHENDFEIAILVIAGIVSTLPMFTGTILDGDDLVYHLMRIEGIKEGILDGQFPVMIYPNALSGNGFLNSMYPYLFIYIPALIRMCGVSLVLSYKIFILVVNIATVLITWKCIRSVSNSGYSATLGALLYIFLPYRYANIYARGAVGEALALTFIPLIIAGFYHLLFGDKKKWFYLIVGFSGILQSHILSFMFMIAFAAISCIVFLKDLIGEKRCNELLKAAVLTLLINLWFIVPFVYFYKYGNLGLGALSWVQYEKSLVNPVALFVSMGATNYRYISLGFAIGICMIFCGLYIYRMIKQKTGCSKMDQYFTMLFILSCFLTLMVTKLSASERLMEFSYFRKILEMVQFPWRLLGPVCAVMIFITPIWIEKSGLICQYDIKKLLFAVLVGCEMLVLMTPSTSMYAYHNDKSEYSDAHETKIRGIQPREHTIVYAYEWRVNGIRNDDVLIQPLVSDENAIKVISYIKHGTKAVCRYKAQNAGRITIPIENYYGYVAQDENGNKLQIKTNHKYAISMDVNSDGKEHEIFIFYEIPLLFKLSTMISVIMIAMLLFRRIHMS